MEEERLLLLLIGIVLSLLSFIIQVFLSHWFCSFVKHRLNTIRRSDAIMVLVNGKIVEQGTYDELIFSKKSSFFRDLVELQNSQISKAEPTQSQLDD
jgi:ABC-type bacteriocin/lantibiotic exporter with double-glycine peptidase domain